MKLLTNPVFLRSAILLFCAVFSFVLGLFMVRRVRKSIAKEYDFADGPTPSVDAMPLHLYNTVIQQLKQQKHELIVQSQAEQHRARTSENFSHAVLSNLSCGVLVFGSNGLVKSSNHAAKTILGFASTTGMSAGDIFREAAVDAANMAVRVFPDGTLDEPVRVSDEVHSVLREGSKRRKVSADYETPAGEKRSLEMTISQVPAADGSLLGAACLITDVSELENIRRQQDLQVEMSAEMALQLRSSLSTISGYAQQLADNRDSESAREIAADIAGEAALLDRSLGGFLTARSAARAAAGK